MFSNHRVPNISAACFTSLALATSLAACGTWSDFQAPLRDGLALLEKDFEEAKPFITELQFEECRKALQETNDSPLLLVRYKLTSEFLPSKTLTCLSTFPHVPQRGPDSPARFIAYGAEITATSGLIISGKPNIYMCRFKVEDGKVSLVSSGIMARAEAFTPCKFSHDPVRLVY